MTTTISKHEVQQQQQQQQEQQQQQHQHRATPATATATISGPIRSHAKHIQFDTLNNNNDLAADEPMQTRAQKRRSLLDFKSFDFHIKALYSGLRVGAGNKSGMSTQSQSRSSSLCGGTSLTVTAIPLPPDLRIEVVDPELEQEHESMNLLLDHSQSPCMPRRVSTTHPSSLSPYFLSPFMAAGGGSGTGSSAAGVDDCGSGNIRRSSTSDIVSCRRRGSGASSNRRPSTSDLLRRARERRGSQARMGRSVSHGTMRGGGGGMGGGGGCIGGRRTSIAF